MKMARPGNECLSLYSSILVAVFLGLLYLPRQGASREIIVSPGAAGEAVIGVALKSASDGDVIRIKRGVYPETIVISRRVAVVGEAGAILDPSEPFRPAWRPAPDIGADVYQAELPKKPGALMLGGKVLAEIDERRTGKDGDWFWKRLLAQGTRRSGFQFVRAIWIYR